MVTRVLDTSVIAKWLLQEEDTPRAEIFLKELEEGRARIAVPSSMFYELTSVLWVQRRIGLTEEQALALWSELLHLPLEAHESPDLLTSALSFSFQYQVSPYDAAFVVLARDLNCELITADRPLWNKTHASCSWVKLL